MKTSRRDPHTSRRLAAYHEAGHAVASFFHPEAGTTTRVTVRESELGEGDAGATYSDSLPLPKNPSAADRRAVRALAVVALAGSEVDRRLTGNALTSGSEDYEAVRELLFRVFFDPEIEDRVASVDPEEARTRGLEAIADEAAGEIESQIKRLVDGLRGDAQRLIESKWHHVEAVATALLERGALDGGEVREIIEAGEPRRRFV